VQGIVAAHDGAIEVESVLGQGSTFHLYFPVSAAVEPAPAPARIAVAARPAAQAARVLLVDDETAILSMAMRLLAHDGHVVRAFDDPDLALAALRETPDAFDIVISDYNMPRQSGLDLARAARALRSDLPIIITSGYVSPELHEQASAAGADHLLYKPELARQLGEIVRRFAASPGADS
jgi:CheY-like chemotaxis protein